MQKFKRVHLEISNVCNLQCSFCPEVLRPKEFMQAGLFEKITNQLKPMVEEICLHLMGEPLVHKGLPGFISHCEKIGVFIQLTTNGTLLSDDKFGMLLSKSIRQINFSVHSFEANFGSQDVRSYLRKIFSFTRTAFDLRPDLYINYRIWDFSDSRSLSETNRLIRNAIEEEYNFCFSNLKIDIRRKKGYRICNRLYVHFDSRFEWPSLNSPFRSKEGFCYGLKDHFGIHADGTVVPCCLDKEAVINLGNCNEQSILSILNSERSRNIKNGFSNGKCIEELCQRCDYIKRFSRKKMVNNESV